MEKVILGIFVIPLLLFMTVLFSLVFGSVIRYMNEGEDFKSPMDNYKPIENMFRDKEFYKTFITGFFVFFTLITLIKYLREW